MAGEDIAQGIPQGIGTLSPVGGIMNAAQGGGQQILQLLAQLLQGQQAQQQPPVAFAGANPNTLPGDTGTPQAGPQSLMQRMLGR